MTVPAAPDVSRTSSTLTPPARGAVFNAPPDPTRSDWLAEYPPPRSLPLDQEALRIYEHAYVIGLQAEPRDSPPVTFTTVLAALLAGGGDTSRWFAAAAQDMGPYAADVLSSKNLAEPVVKNLVPRPGKPESVRLSKDKHLLTASARAVIENADRWAQKVGGSDIGVRHLVASYVLNPPPAHRSQMQRWGYQEQKWRSEFFTWVAERYTAERWTDASHRPAPTKAVLDFEQQLVKGEALAFPGDASTLAVLEKAAAYHARRTDQWLRHQTVFCALVETAREDAAVRETIQPIWNAVVAAGDRYGKAYGEFFPAAAPAGAVAPFSALDISPRVLNALETARELALAGRQGAAGEYHVGVLHLAGALVSRRVDGDEDLAKMGLEPQPLRIALVHQAQRKGESADVWREGLGEEESLQAGRPVDLNSDEPEAVVRLDASWASDPLAIRRDVETFAALLASKTLEPPLSIGLFGPWGSGKTTFLKRLHRAVERRADEATKAIASGQPTPYVSNVVHVDFNAWHFAEHALTSSLVDTILRALSDYIKEDKQIAGKAWRQQKLEALVSTKRKVEAAQALEQAAAAAVSKAEAALADSRAKAATALTGVQASVERVWAATKEALRGSPEVKNSGVLDAVGDAVATAEQLRDRLTAMRTRPARLLSDLGWGRSLLFAGLVLAVPPIVAAVTRNLLAGDQAVQVMSFMTATLSVFAVWARAATSAVSKVDQAIAKVADTYAKQLADDPNVKDAQATLDAAQSSAATAAAGVTAAQEELARARAEAANATLPAQMLQLVSSRLDAQAYNRELTTLSLARADLQALSVILRDQRNGSATPADAASSDGNGATPPARAVDRVVLYIDDLDRCKPEDVVRVLQLVHMLLAFELFVVVVAVDARWVEEALRQSYSWLAESDPLAPDTLPGKSGERRSRGAARVTPQDYLEKIFQIAFWLEPMTAARAASYLGSLVPAATRESGPVLGVASTPSSTPTAPAGAKVGIAGIELDYMRALAAYVGSSPRRVKRLVNAYRLIKAGMSDAQLGTFLTDRAADDGGLRSGPYQIVIGLLVIGTGASTASALILKELAESDPRDGMDEVVERFRARNHPEWTMAAQVIETVLRTQKAKNVSELRGWARKVGRFLLNGPSADQRVNGVPHSVPPPQAKADVH
jgi:hypothetical protein